MLRSAFIVFVAGWAGWFLLDKPYPLQRGFPHASENLLENFQLAFDMARAGYWIHAYIFIWHAHYIVLSLLLGALLAMLFSSLSGQLGRRRMRRLMLPTNGKNPAQESLPEQACKEPDQ